MAEIEQFGAEKTDSLGAGRQSASGFKAGTQVRQQCDWSLAIILEKFDHPGVEARCRRIVLDALLSWVKENLTGTGVHQKIRARANQPGANQADHHRQPGRAHNNR